MTRFPLHATKPRVLRLATTVDDEEVLALLISTVAACSLAFRFYRKLSETSRFERDARPRRALALTPVALLVLIGVALRLGADVQVRSSYQYQALFVVVGGAWLFAVLRLLPIFGLSAEADVAARGNRAALTAILGAQLGACLCYAGANLGAGDTIWTTLGPAALAAALFLGAWFLHELIARAFEAVAIEHDLEAGVRLGGFLTAVGLLAGRAAAGDWVSHDATARDFGSACVPIGLLTVAAAGVHRARVAYGARAPLAGGAFATVYVLSVGAWIVAR